VTNLDDAVAALNALLSDPEASATPPESLRSHPGFVEVYQEAAAIREHLLAISRGDLRRPLREKGVLTGCLKSLQANLRHLTWQTQMIAEGDFTQRVEFLGDFSVAFNAMTDALAQAKAELEQSEARYRLLAENAADVIVTLDRQRRFTYVSPSVLRMMGYRPDQLIGRSIAEFSSQAAEFHHGTVVEMPLACADGSVRWAEMSIGPVPAGAGQDADLVCVIRDITDWKRLQENLRHLAAADGLTGAVNRRHFVELGTCEIAKAVPRPCPTSLLLMDIDHFKQINDRYGHLVGDEVLKQGVEACRRTLRSEDALGRVGGDEFAVLLPGTSAADAVRVAERLRRIYASLVISTPEGERVGVTISIGVAHCQAGEISMEELLRRADCALYEAKRTGRNCVRSCEEVAGGCEE